MSRTAVVTGAAGGIGLGVAQALAAAGHRVALLDKQGGLVAGAAAELAATGATVVAHEVDVTDQASVHSALDEVRTAFGPITIMATSAGVAEFSSITDLTVEKWERMLRINLTGTFYCLQAVVPDMIEAKWGRMVTISSSSAQSGAPKMAHYVASKGGVIGLTKALAMELAEHGITVNTIPPTLVDTPMVEHWTATGDFPGVDVIGPLTPLRRAGTPADIGSAAAYLCSEAAGFITGQLIGVNGGMYI
jgi:NAD(P)-dependent dehydrogenase (short-subunit alcohol dehydrogenase family)